MSSPQVVVLVSCYFFVVWASITMPVPEGRIELLDYTVYSTEQQ